MQEFIQTALSYFWWGLVGLAVLIIGLRVLGFLILFIASFFWKDKESDDDDDYSHTNNTYAEDIKILEDRTIPSMVNYYYQRSNGKGYNEGAINYVLDHLRSEDIELIRRFYPDERYLVHRIVYYPNL